VKTLASERALFWHAFDLRNLAASLQITNTLGLLNRPPKGNDQMKSGLGKTDWKEARLFDPDMHENPYPIYREFRQHDPVHWDDGLQVVSCETPRKRS
jgi:hypothetical protein